MGAHLFHADGQTDMTKLVVAFRNFSKAPKCTGDSFARQSDEKNNWPLFVQLHSCDEVPSARLVTKARQLYLLWKCGLTLGKPMRNLTAKLWIFSHVLLKVPFMTVSLAVSQNGLTWSHLKAEQ
jgi:hypothetical protein